MKYLKQKRSVDRYTVFDETLLARNRMLTIQITNLILTTTLAKTDIINLIIFDHDKLRSILNKHHVEVPTANLT